MTSSDTVMIDVETTTGEYVLLDGEKYFRIANSHLMPDFFMSLVGASDHWMFVSSNGSLTAGRQNPDNALFPYASDDQLSAARGETGALTLVRLNSGEVWEPFAPHTAQSDTIVRNIYKTPLGNKLVFEEINETLQLAFRYRWTFSERFGFVRSCRLENIGQASRSFELLDGLRNVLPYGVGSEFLMRYSNLANAYKKNERVAKSDVGIFYLSSIPTDRAEPSEGLKATTVWQSGLSPDAILLSSTQVPAFRQGHRMNDETEVRGKAGAFLACQSGDLAPGNEIRWHFIAELGQDYASVAALDQFLQTSSGPMSDVDNDIAASEEDFLRIISSADGIQCGANDRRSNRHLSNTVFNLMRGGVPVDNYRVPTDDFAKHVAQFNQAAFQRHESFLNQLDPVVDIEQLRESVAALNDPDMTRLSLEYLPLCFSRRHGDPSRPWNRFSIDLRSEDGETSLNYQGNWRDIFQNWEALLVSYPTFSTAMACRFVNATTADGYNPYRLTKDGFEWEEPHEDDPWANIGYWGDHQIIYLLKILEWTRQFDPAGLDRLLDSPFFTHANVPYRIKGFDAIKQNPRDTIEFDNELAATIRQRVASVGSDGKLVRNQKDQIHYVTLLEKILTLSLAKLSNFIPDGGIWLNTQRPEWNDANNALVGNGLSMVTACYLHRWFNFFHDYVTNLDSSTDSFSVSAEVANFFNSIARTLQQYEGALDGPIDAKVRLEIVTALSEAGAAYRNGFYADGMTSETKHISRDECLALFASARNHLAATIRSNKRTDGLYHAYNLIDFDSQPGGVEIEYLYEMLEGQVAVLSAGLLTPAEAVDVMDALRKSALYRENQDSYLLYPDRQLPKFLEKNILTESQVASNALVQKLLADGNTQAVVQDVNGAVHFNGQFRNSADLRLALDGLDDKYSAEVKSAGDDLVQTFESIFGHRQFTGRSGTFFGYEGLGSIYWHMVSKLGLAVSENVFAAIEAGASTDVVDALKVHLEAVRHGIGAEKTPTAYGAFPSDPYSHTPENAGVKQPGMTGQVKEDVLARFAEIGVHIEQGCLCFRMSTFDRGELLSQSETLRFYGLDREVRTIDVPANGFGFTLFQVPVIYSPGETDKICVYLTDGKQVEFEGNSLDDATSRELFNRTGVVDRVECQCAILGK